MLADDMLKGAAAIAAYTGFTEREIRVWGDVRTWSRRKVLPVFWIGKHLCARKSELNEVLSGASLNNALAQADAEVN